MDGMEYYGNPESYEKIYLSIFFVLLLKLTLACVKNTQNVHLQL